MKSIKYKIQDESMEDQGKAGRYNPCQELVFNDKSGQHTVKIGAGRMDDLDVYQDGEETYVLCRNYGLDYVGLEVFEGDYQVWDMFLQNTEQIQDILGPKGLDLMPYNIINRMLQYMG